MPEGTEMTTPIKAPGVASPVTDSLKKKKPEVKSPYADATELKSLPNARSPKRKIRSPQAKKKPPGHDINERQEAVENPNEVEEEKVEEEVPEPSFLEKFTIKLEQTPIDLPDDTKEAFDMVFSMINETNDITENLLHDQTSRRFEKQFSPSTQVEPSLTSSAFAEAVLNDETLNDTSSHLNSNYYYTLNQIDAEQDRRQKKESYYMNDRARYLMLRKRRALLLEKRREMAEKDGVQHLLEPHIKEAGPPSYEAIREMDGTFGGVRNFAESGFNPGFHCTNAAGRKTHGGQGSYTYSPTFQQTKQVMRAQKPEGLALALKKLGGGLHKLDLTTLRAIVPRFDMNEAHLKEIIRMFGDRADFAFHQTLRKDSESTKGGKSKFDKEAYLKEILQSSSESADEDSPKEMQGPISVVTPTGVKLNLAGKSRDELGNDSPKSGKKERSPGRSPDNRSRGLYQKYHLAPSVSHQNPDTAIIFPNLKEIALPNLGCDAHLLGKLLKIFANHDPKGAAGRIESLVLDENQLEFSDVKTIIGQNKDIMLPASDQSRMIWEDSTKLFQEDEKRSAARVGQGWRRWTKPNLEDEITVKTGLSFDDAPSHAADTESKKKKGNNKGQRASIVEEETIENRVSHNRPLSPIRKSNPNTPRVVPDTIKKPETGLETPRGPAHEIRFYQDMTISILDFMRSYPNLKHLSLRDCGIDEFSIKRLILPKSIVSLILDDNPLLDMGFIYLIKYNKHIFGDLPKSIRKIVREYEGDDLSSGNEDEEDVEDESEVDEMLAEIRGLGERAAEEKAKIGGPDIVDVKSQNEAAKPTKKTGNSLNTISPTDIEDEEEEKNAAPTSPSNIKKDTPTASSTASKPKEKHIFASISVQNCGLCMGDLLGLLFCSYKGLKNFDASRNEDIFINVMDIHANCDLETVRFESCGLSLEDSKKLMWAYPNANAFFFGDNPALAALPQTHGQGDKRKQPQKTFHPEVIKEKMEKIISSKHTLFDITNLGKGCTYISLRNLNLDGKFMLELIWNFFRDNITIDLSENPFLGMQSLSILLMTMRKLKEKTDAEMLKVGRVQILKSGLDSEAGLNSGGHGGSDHGSEAGGSDHGRKNSEEKPTDENIMADFFGKYEQREKEFAAQHGLVDNAEDEEKKLKAEQAAMQAQMPLSKRNKRQSLPYVLQEVMIEQTGEILQRKVYRVWKNITLIYKDSIPGLENKSEAFMKQVISLREELYEDFGIQITL